jgi:nucleotide-binding universal stress UspA family protein
VKGSAEPDASRNVKISNSPAFPKILAAVDGSKSAAKAAKVGVKLAKRNAAELIVISVVPRPSYLFAPVSGAGVPPMGLGDYYTCAKKNAEASVNEAVSSAKGQGVEAKGRVLKSASVVQSVTDYAQDQEIDLVILGTRGSGGFKRLLVGSVSNDVVNHAHCSVMVIR